MIPKVAITDQGLIVSYGYLMANGISKGLIYKNVSKAVWTKAELIHGGKKGKYISHDSLTNYALSKLPSFEELVGLAETEKLRNQLNKKSDNNKTFEICKSELLLALESYEKYIPQALTIFPSLSTKAATIISKNYAILISCNDLRASKIKIKDILNSYHQIRAIEPEIKQISKTDTISLNRRIEAIMNNGISGIIDKRIGTERTRRKFNKELQFIAEKAYSESPITLEQVKLILNNHCKQNGLHPVSLTTLKDHFAKPQIRNRVLPLKYGDKWFNDNLRPYIPRKKPDYPGSKNVIDGTALQFIAKDDNGRQLRLDFFVDFDVHSGKILGFDFSHSETSVTVFNALQRAFNNIGYLPAELVSDNSSAIKSQEIQRLFTRMKRLGVKVRPAKVGNAQDKEIEQFFRTFHNYMRDVPGWIGGNITIKSPSYRPSKEYILEVHKKNGIPNIETLKAIIITLIDQYNCDDLNGRICPARKHEEGLKQFVIRPSCEEIAFLFWPERIIKITKGIVIRHSGSSKYHYSIYSHEDKLKLIGREVIIKYNNDCIDEVYLFDPETEAYLCTCGRIHQPNSAQIEQTDEDRLQMIKQASHNGGFREYIRKLNQGKAKEIQELTGKEAIDYTGVFELRKEAIKNSEFSELQKYYNDFGIDLTKVDMTKFESLHSKEWEFEKVGKDYSQNPYKEKGNYCPVISSEDINEPNNDTN